MSARPRRIGLFGGSFDPVHGGHLHAARAARDAFVLDRVIFMPAARPPHKAARELVSGDHRVEMIRRAIAGEAGLEVSTIELERPGPSYTIDTLRELRSAIGEPAETELYLVMGSDSLEHLAGWRAVREIVREAQPIVVLRGVDREVPAELVRVLGPELAGRLERGFVRRPPAPGSSTQMRERLERGDPELSDLPDSVREYVIQHGLYRVER